VFIGAPWLWNVCNRVGVDLNLAGSIEIQRVDQTQTQWSLLVNANIDKLLILKYLQQFESGQVRIERDLKDLKTQLGSLEHGHDLLIQRCKSLSKSIALKTNPLPP
jgi:hypothetical protein